VRNQANTYSTTTDILELRGFASPFRYPCRACEKKYMANWIQAVFGTKSCTSHNGVGALFFFCERTPWHRASNGLSRPPTINPMSTAPLFACHAVNDGPACAHPVRVTECEPGARVSAVINSSKDAAAIANKTATP
jgi:hypothetical protein